MSTHPSPRSRIFMEYERGYAALLSTLVICAVLTVLAFKTATSAYLARLSVLESEYAATARADAYSCAQALLFELSADPSYRPPHGGDTVLLPIGTSCLIEAVYEERGALRATVRGTYKDSATTLEMQLQENLIPSPSFLVLSFREI